MTQTDYEQKKRECWEEYKRENLDGEVQWQPVGRYDVFCAAFDRAYVLGKQDKDAEGEEMLTVPRRKVQEMYARNDAICNAPERPKDYLEPRYEYADAITLTLADLFGSKCLPDDTKEPKPAEPKYALSDKVMLNGHGGFEITAVYLDPYTQEYKYCLGEFKCHFCESDLEPYTEPEEYVNLSQNIVDCDKQLDNILKDGFRNERRLNIATQIMSSILSNQMMLNNLAHGETTTEGVVKCIVNATKMYTDALIAECEEGGKS